MPNETQQDRGRGIRRRILLWSGIVLIALVALWGVTRLISKLVDETVSTVTEPIGAIGDAVGEVWMGAGKVINQAAENTVETLEKGTQTREWKLAQVNPIGNLHYDPIECPSRAIVDVEVTLTEVHGRLIFGEDSDTFSGTVPVTVRPCVYLDAVTVSADGGTITVDATKMHFDPDPHAVEFMLSYLKDRNPADEEGVERLVESGWLAWIPLIGQLQGTLQDPERTEISGVLIALGEGAAANSTCIQSMWEGVKAHTIRFYEDQAARQGRDDVTVHVVGEPDIYQNDYLLEELFDAATEREIDITVEFEDIVGSCDITYEN